MILPVALYLDTSAVLRHVLEAGTSPGIDSRLKSSKSLVTSRLSIVESDRTIIRARAHRRVKEIDLVEAEKAVNAIWARCYVLDVTPEICDRARIVAPTKPIRSLDAIHLATFLVARLKYPALELLTADERLRAAAESI